MSPLNGFQEVACAPDQLEADIVSAFFFKEERPLTGVAGLLDWRLNGLVTALLLNNRLTGEDGECLAVRSNGKVRADWVLFLGCGSVADLNPGRWEHLFRRLWTTLQRLRIGRVAFGFQPYARRLDDEPADIARKSWAALAGEKPGCLVSFDRSWLHR